MAGGAQIKASLGYAIIPFQTVKHGNNGVGEEKRKPKCLGDWSSIPSCMLVNIDEVEMVEPGSLWAAALAYLASSSKWEIVSTQRWMVPEEWHLGLRSLAHPPMYACTHACSYVHTQREENNALCERRQTEGHILNVSFMWSIHN